jgi:aminopeptidase N
MASSAALDRDILPDNVKPINYDISIFDLELGGAFSYQGSVAIQLKISKGSKDITLNSHQLKILGAELSIEQTKTTQAFKATGISYDAPRQRATLSFPEDIPMSENATLFIQFQGTMNNDMAGFYRSKYKPAAPQAASVPRDDEWHYQFSTQFESCDARRAFPCFDEPNLKATFDFKIEIPEDQVALSNMPQKSMKKSTKPKFHVVSFEKTPIVCKSLEKFCSYPGYDYEFQGYITLQSAYVSSKQCLGTIKKKSIPRLGPLNTF